MIVDGEFIFPASRETVWELLQDPDVLAKALPGTQKLARVAEDSYEGLMRVGVGPVTAAQWVVGMSISDKVVPVSYTLHVDGKGTLGFTRGSARVELVDEDSGAATRMIYRANLQIGGKVAGVGQRLLDQVSKLMTRQGLEALNRELGARIA
jgi:carbon monoxide dehydrogenase subunit G